MQTQVINDKTYANISELTPWDKNPRSINDFDLDRLIKQRILLGQYKPSLVTQDGILLGGNMRFKADTTIHNWEYEQMLAYLQDFSEAELLFLVSRIYKAEPTGIPQVNEDLIKAVFAEFENVWVSIVDVKDENEMMKYSLSDNDRAGYYDAELLAKLLPDFDIDQKLFSVDLTMPELLEDIMPNYPGQGINPDMTGGLGGEQTNTENGEQPKQPETANGINITYNIIFDTTEQQKKWFTFLKGLKKKYPDKGTIAECLVAYIEETSE